jgi:osmotically-inducible protein OsmY
MIDVQTAQPVVDESSRYRDQSWLSMEDGKRIDVADPVIVGDYPAGWITVGLENLMAPFDGLIHVGQKVFLPGDHLIGLTTKLFVDPSKNITHLAIRTARLFGHHKMVPIAFVSEVNPFRVLLSITRKQFKELPEYQSDPSIAEAVDQALWNDGVLRHTDYHEINVQVRDGVVRLHGHVMTSMNQWRAETAVKNIPGVLGVRSFLIPDDKLTQEVAGTLGQMEQDTGSRFFTKVENGVVVLVGEVSSTALRDKAEQCAAEIPWVRGVINEICVAGMVLEPEDQRFLQPWIGNELLFKDALSVIIRKVVINPHNRRVVAVIVLGRFPSSLRQEQNWNYLGESAPERMVVLPSRLILNLTGSGGMIRINSDETTEYQDYDPSRYHTPDKDWLPPYPYCTDEVLFLAE